LDYLHRKSGMEMYTTIFKLNTNLPNSFQDTALAMACCCGFLEIADFLIKATADIELGNSTPLMKAAQKGHFELVHYLLDAKAKVRNNGCS